MPATPQNGPKPADQDLPPEGGELRPAPPPLYIDLDDEEPLSLAEEIAAGTESPPDEIQERYEQIKQSGDTHIAELQRMSMGELIEEARKENLSDYAGIKKQDLIFKILKERVKLNGLMYGEGTLEVLPDGFGFLRRPGLPLPLLPGQHLRLAQPDPAVRAEDGGHRFRPDPPAQGERALFRPVAGRGHQLPGPQPGVGQGALRRSHPAAPRRADPHGDHPRRGQHAGGRSDRAHRLRAAGADRQSAAGGQDHPDAKNGQGRPGQLSRPVRVHAPYRRAPRRSDRHGAAGEGQQLRGHQTRPSTSRRPDTSRSRKWCSRRPSGWSSTATTC